MHSIVLRQNGNNLALTGRPGKELPLSRRYRTERRANQPRNRVQKRLAILVADDSCAPICLFDRTAVIERFQPAISVGFRQTESPGYGIGHALGWTSGDVMCRECLADCLHYIRVVHDVSSP